MTAENGSQGSHAGPETEDRERLRRLADELDWLVTESVPHGTPRPDTLDTIGIVRLMNREDAGVAAAVESVLPAVAAAVELITASFERGGRLFYIGAGTSGRLGVLDASECPPTFGSDPSLVTGVIAGGRDALVRSSEGLEDDGGQGWTDLEAAGVAAGDVVVGITASTRTPYVIGALARARSRGVGTIYLTCNPQGSPDVEADVTINPVVGPEIVAGSTRLKAGTATKMILNMLTTATFVKQGKVYGNLMVDVRPVSDKLRARARRIVMLACGVEFDEADAALRSASEEIRIAILMLQGGLSEEEARILVDESGTGRGIRELLDGLPPACDSDRSSDRPE
jgi:N-acetylmuramic acid 6-phosphate etherase